MDCAVEDDGPIVLVIDSGRADPRTMTTWTGAEAAQWPCLQLTDCTSMLKNCDSLSPHINDGTLTNLHNEWI